jgi:hypothetical protein
MRVVRTLASLYTPPLAILEAVVILVNELRSSHLTLTSLLNKNMTCIKNTKNRKVDNFLENLFLLLL